MHNLSSLIICRPSSLYASTLGFCIVLFGLGFYLSFTATAQSPTPLYTIIKDQSKQLTIQVTGEGAVTTLPEIKQALPVTLQNYLVNQGNGFWLLNVNLSIDNGATLNLSPQTGVAELRLRSDGPALAENQTKNQTENQVDAQSASSVAGAVSDEIPLGDEAETLDESEMIQAASNAANFVYLRTLNGTINIDGIQIYSWNASAKRVDNNYQDGRAYILAKLAATLNIRNADIGYLGSKDQESYGLSWRDQNDPADPKVLRTRVTGELINSNIHNNYYGIYTFQAINMVFRGNRFHHNIRYGFDPHDYSHHILVEDNLSYNNAAHGFIISRGCNNFIFRRNKSYDNFDPSGNQAHGFMLDPGGTGVGKPQVPSSQNIIEDNEAYGNEGSGVRLLMATNNQIRNNNFHNNNTGVTIDIRSANNLVTNNQFTQNTSYGLQIMRNSTVNTATLNLMAQNGADGINLQINARQNVLQGNIVRNNLRFGISAQGSQTTQNLWSQNLVYANQRAGILLAGGANGNLTAPLIITSTANSIIIQTKPHAMLEIYSDVAVQGANGEELPAQGQYYEGQIKAGDAGRATFTITGNWKGNRITVLAHDDNNNASAFSAAIQAPDAATPTAVSTPMPTGTATQLPSATPTSVISATVTPAQTPQPTATQLTTATVTATVTEVIVVLPPTLTAIATMTNVATVSQTPQPFQTPTVTPSAVSTPPVNDLNQRIYMPLVQEG